MPDLRNSDSPAVISRSTSVANLAAFNANAAEPEPFSLLLSHYFKVVWGRRWWILLTVILAGAATLAISKHIAPIYESTAAIQIDRRGPTGVVGQESTQSVQGDAEQFIATQVRLIQSASVLRPVAQQFGLLSTDPPVNNSSTPDVKGSVSLPGLKVIQVPGTYIVLISYRSESPTKSAEVANAVASGFIKETYTSRITSTRDVSQYMEKQIDELRAKMERSSAAVIEYGKELTIVNPEDKTNIQASRLIQLNSDYTAAQLDRVRKEATFKEMQNGTLESAQTSAQGEGARKLAEKLQEAEDRFEHVKTLYGAKHPEYEKAQTEVALLKQALGNTTTNTLKRVKSEYEEAISREEMLKNKVDDLKTQVDSLNTRSTQYQAMIREADADRKLYEELMQKIKEAAINSGFDNNSIRIADPAQAETLPVSPNVRNNVAVAMMLSLFLSIAGVVLIDTMNTTVRDPESITRLTRTEVVGILPFVKNWKGRKHVLARNEGPDPGAIVPFSESRARGSYEEFDGFDEAMRSLRNTILLSAPNGTIRKLLFTSASPAEGKTTTAVHVAVAHALQGNKTLLIDADLRRPGTQQILGYNSDTGLSNVILENKPWREAITSVPSVANLDILPAGARAGHAASLLERVVPEILRDAQKEYSLIVIDAPPMLGFSEPLQLAAMVDGVVLIALAGRTNRKDVATMLHTLRRLGAQVIGIALNGVTKELAERYDYPGTYGAYHSHYYDKAAN
jgi:capsular exopolysaccharide synthesis family protein